jgi:hypothetical protein
MSIIFVLYASSATAKTLRASLAQMPIHALSTEEGVQVNLVKAIEAISNHNIEIDLYPFARSVDNVINSRADFHIPLIKNDIISADKLPFAYSTETIFQVNFVLYVNTKNSININNLSDYRVETDRAHINYFPFKAFPSDSIRQSLTRLHHGMIDAYIFADTSTDPILRDQGFKNIARSLYKVFDVKIVIPKGTHGEFVDNVLSKAIQQLRSNGQLQQIEESVNFTYNNWQPKDAEK